MTYSRQLSRSSKISAVLFGRAALALAVQRNARTFASAISWWQRRQIQLRDVKLASLADHCSAVNEYFPSKVRMYRTGSVDIAESASQTDTHWTIDDPLQRSRVPSNLLDP